MHNTCARERDTSWHMRPPSRSVAATDVPREPAANCATARTAVARTVESLRPMPLRSITDRLRAVTLAIALFAHTASAQPPRRQGGPTASIESVRVVDGPIELREARRAAHARTASFRDCYLRARATDNRHARITLAIDASGHVTSATVTGAGSLERCITDAASASVFPAHDAPSHVELRVFLFSATALHGE